jgi:hypothetical protein
VSVVVVGAFGRHSRSRGKMAPTGVAQRVVGDVEFLGRLGNGGRVTKATPPLSPAVRLYLMGPSQPPTGLPPRMPSMLHLLKGICMSHRGLPVGRQM